MEWLGQVPAHWEVKRLKHACEVFPSSVDKKSYDGETPVRLCNYTDVYYHEQIVAGMDFMAATASPEQIDKFTLRAGDTIITKDSETADDIAIGAYVPADLPGVVCGYHLSMVRPMPDSDGAFVKRLFDSVYAKSCFAVLANGLTRVGLGQYELDNVELPFPPRAEQTAIAEFLDRETGKIDGLVTEQRRLMELLKEKRQAVISHAVTRGLNPAARLCPSGFDWIGDIPDHWTLPPLYVRYEQVLGKMLDEAKLTGKHPTPYLRNADVRWDYFNVEDLPIIDIRPEEKERFMVRRGDLLTLEGRELGRAAIWNGDDHVVAFQKALHRLRPLNRSEHSRYLYYTLAFANGTGVFLADQSPDEIPHLTGEQLRSYRFPRPPLDEQVAIVEFLDRETRAFDTLTVEAQRAIDLLQERRSALISAAVTGQIDVRGLATGAQRLWEKLDARMARAVLAAEILTRCAPFRPVRKVRLQKLIHLSEYEGELTDIQGDYERQALGPYDEELMDEVAAELFARRWYEQKKEEDHFIYVPLEKAGEHTAYLSHWGDKLVRVQRVLDLLKSFATNRCERYSTLYAAWNDLLLKGRTPTDDEIIHEASDPVSWHERKGDFASESWVESLRWMKEHDLVPKGFGRHTRKFRSPRRTVDRTGAQMDLL